MALVYIHRKKTNNHPFYVGMSTNSDRPYEYYSKHRTSLWNRTAKKYGVFTEVIEKDVSKDQALELEEFIVDLYGRRIVDGGMLVNIARGGLKIDHEHLQKKVHQYALNGDYLREWESFADASRYYGLHPSSKITGAVKRKGTCVGFQWRDYKTNRLLSKSTGPSSTPIPIEQIDNKGTVVNTFTSAAQAGRETGIEPVHIREVVRECAYRHTAGGYKWRKVKV